MRLSAVLLALGMAIICALPAEAKGLSFKADPPGVWRVMTQDDATSTSKCIGKLKTPICAVETFLACGWRKKNDLCHQAWPSIRWEYYGETVNGGKLFYRFSKMEFLRKKDIPSWVNNIRNTPIIAQDWRAGDLKIGVSKGECWGKVCDDFLHPPPIESYQLRRGNNGWFIIGAGGDW